MNTATPVWQGILASGQKVVAATFPGADGLNVTVPGLPNSPIIQSAAERTTTFTVPFGAFGGSSAAGFVLNASNFAEDNGSIGVVNGKTVTQQLVAAGHASFSSVLVTKAPFETITSTIGGGGPTGGYQLMAAAVDTTDDGVQKYDTLVVFERTIGIEAGPFNNLITGPAYLKNDDKDAPFYLEGSNNRVGTGFFLSKLDPLFWTTDAGSTDTIHLARLCLQLHPAQLARDPGRGQRQQQRRFLVVRARLPHRRAPDAVVRAVQRRRTAGDRQRRHQAVRRLPGAAGCVRHAADARRGPRHGLHRGARRPGTPVPADRPAAGRQPDRPELDRHGLRRHDRLRRRSDGGPVRRQHPGGLPVRQRCRAEDPGSGRHGRQRRAQERHHRRLGPRLRPVLRLGHHPDDRVGRRPAGGQHGPDECGPGHDHQQRHPGGHQRAGRQHLSQSRHAPQRRRGNGFEGAILRGGAGDRQRPQGHSGHRHRLQPDRSGEPVRHRPRPSARPGGQRSEPGSVDRRPGRPG